MKLLNATIAITIGVILCATLLVPTIDSAQYEHNTHANEGYTYLATTHLNDAVTYSVDSDHNLLANGEIVAPGSAHSAGVSAPMYSYQSHSGGVWASVKNDKFLTTGTTATLTPDGHFTISDASATSSDYIAAVADGELAVYSLHEGPATFAVTEGHKVILTANYSQLSDDTTMFWRAVLVGDEITIEYATNYATSEGTPLNISISISSNTSITTQDGVTTYEDFAISMTGVSAASRYIAVVEKEYTDSVEVHSGYTALLGAIPVMVILALVVCAVGVIRSGDKS